jgi:copper chaperone
MERITIGIEGMSCGHCVAAVAGVLRGIDGVQVEEVQIGGATVAYDPARVRPEQLADAIEEEGYAAHVGAN